MLGLVTFLVTGLVIAGFSDGMRSAYKAMHAARLEAERRCARQSKWGKPCAPCWPTFPKASPWRAVRRNFLIIAQSKFAEDVARPLDLREIARKCIAELQRTHPERTIELRADRLPVCPGDPVLLRQLLMNLLSNAFKFTRHCKHASIEIGSYNAEDGPVFYVRDNGAGFDMRYVDKIFGVFERLHSAEEYEGTGVGLAIVKRVVERHGGKVWAESRLGEGTTFYFTLRC